jgi:hypothetical protein
MGMTRRTPLPPANPGFQTSLSEVSRPQFTSQSGLSQTQGSRHRSAKSSALSSTTAAGLANDEGRGNRNEEHLR